MPSLPFAAAVLAAGLAAAGAARADDKDPCAVKPYRPSVSTPVDLTGPGCLELEAGGLRATGPGPDSRDSLPYTLKLAFDDQWGVRLGGDAWVRQDAGGQVAKGGGDTSLVLKHRFGDSPWGLELGQKFPTAGATLGSGRADTTLNGIFSHDLPADLHTDLNLAETRVGLSGSHAHGWQTAWAASLSWAPDQQRWGLGAEFSGTHQAAVPDTAQFLFAVSWTWTLLELDVGGARGLTGASPHDQVFAGMTVSLGKLF